LLILAGNRPRRIGQRSQVRGLPRPPNCSYPSGKAA
jgi:hypothetical protein